MADLKSRLSDLLTLYLTVLSLFEAIVLEQLISRAAEVSGGTFFEGWTVDLVLQALIVLTSVFFMWVGFVTITAPIRRVIGVPDFIIPFSLGGVQLISIRLMELTLEPSFLALYSVGCAIGYLAMHLNIRGAQADSVSRSFAQLYPLRDYAVLTVIATAAAIIGAASLSVSRLAGQILAGTVLTIMALMVIGLLRWWDRLVAMHRIDDPTSDSSLKLRVTGLLPIYLTLLCMIEAIVLGQLIARVEAITGGQFLDGWTLNLGLQAAVVLTSMSLIWVGYLMDMIPIRRVMNSLDLVNLIGLGLVQLVAIQLMTLDIQASFLVLFGVGSLGGAVFRHHNQKAALTDQSARELVLIYPHRETMILLGIVAVVGIAGGLILPSVPATGQFVCFLMSALLATATAILLSQWSKIANKLRVQE